MTPRAKTLVLAAIVCAGWVESLATETGPWTPGKGYRSAPLNVPKTGKVGFTLLTPAATHIAFTNYLTEAHAAKNRILENGSGVALGDVDGDGWCDIYFCRLDGGNVLYRNLGNWHFEDVTAAAGVACPGQFSTGAVFADVDGDGDLDLLVNCIGGGTRLFLNDGKGHFTEAPAPGLTRRFGSTSLALADLNGDGNLDLYVTNYRTDTIRDAPPGLKATLYQTPDGKIEVQPADRFMIVSQGAGGVKITERGEPDILYLNNGHGVFTPVSWTNGTFLDDQANPLRTAPLDWGLSVALRDLNGDGLPDIYVCNDFNFSPDRIWLNQGHGTFRALPRLAMREMSWSSMAADFADINRDGHLDFFVSEMLSRQHRRRQTQRMNFRPETMRLPFGVIDNRPEYMRNTLFLNRGDGTYAEIAQLSGVDASEWTWSAIFLDVDLDGYEDLLIANGSAHDILDSDANLELEQRTRRGPIGRTSNILSFFPALPTPNLAFRNRGDLTFAEVGHAWGFDTSGVSQGMALADLDNDGDLDVVINNLNEAAGVYRNDTDAPRLAVRLRGLPPNTYGIGAKIEVLGGPVIQSQEMVCGGRYLSCDDTERTFAAFSLTNRFKIRVAWRSGKQSVVHEALPNCLYEIQEAGAEEMPPASVGDSESAPKPMFEDVSELVHHSHHEEEFDDFARQPLLPKKLSQLGPGVSWFDLNGDGYEDLIIGTGKGGQMAVYINQAGHGFELMNPLAPPAARDQSALVGWRTPEATSILAGSANYEDGSSSSPAVLGYALGDPTATDLIPGYESSVGPIALADIDGDGDLDLFVGGRVLPGRYPAAASSRIFRNENGHFVLDGDNSAVLSEVGLVSGAVFSDLDGDGLPELVLACEWGPIRVFKNKGGQFTEATKSLGFANFKGWWNGVTAGDFDGDGRLDIVAANWGRNNKYEAYRADSLRIYFGDFAGRGALDIMEAHWDPELSKVVPWRTFDILAPTLPFVRDHFSGFQQFGTASVEQILGERTLSCRQLDANWLDSTVFLNRGDHFEAHPLPLTAQMAPAFGVIAADFDGDGSQDVFLSQNFFPVEPETSRYDAGRGLLLKGNGQGNFQPISGQESGVLVYGDQRGCATCDFDHDGRLDLVVCQNAGPTVLLHNRSARPGLRVKLKGPPGNPDAVGAAIRLMFGTRAGPAQETHAGSGYWSQDSATVVLGTPIQPTALWVRWPGGRTTISSITPGSRELTVDYVQGP